MLSDAGALQIYNASSLHCAVETSAKFTAHSDVEDSLVNYGAVGMISVAALRLSMAKCALVMIYLTREYKSSY